MNDKSAEKKSARLKRSRRVRSRIKGTSERPRLVVFKSLKHIYAQLVDDASRRTLTGVSSLKGGLNIAGNQTEKAKAVGAAIAKKAKDLGLESLVFDRSGYIYHGRIKALAEAVRESGLKF